MDGDQQAPEEWINCVLWPLIMGKQYCSVCARPKAGHPLPFGPKCKMPPLPEDVKQKYLDEQKQLALENRLSQGDTVETLSIESEEDENLGDDDLELKEAEEKKLEAMKLELLAKRDRVQEQLARQRKAKEVNDRIKKLKEEMAGLDKSLQAEISEMKANHEEFVKPEPPLELPGLSTQILPTHQNSVPQLQPQQLNDQQQ